jgi:hypothetical protein
MKWQRRQNWCDMKSGFPSAKSVLVSSKLMRCWAKKAKESKRINHETLKEIIDTLPKFIDSLPSQPASPATEVTTEATTNATEVTTEATREVRNVANQDAEIPQCVRQFAGNQTFFMLDASVIVVLTANRSYDVFDVESKEAVFYEKNQNIENQIGACFNRSKDVFRMHATASLEMINDVQRKKTTFAEQMQVLHREKSMCQ